MPASPPTEQTPLRACHECGAALRDEHQEMCVECGVAVAPDPKAARVRRVLSPTVLGLFATLMVASAAYGVTSNAGGENASIPDKIASAAPAQPAPAAPAQHAPAAPPPPAPASANPAPVAKPPAPPPPPAAKPATPATPAPAPKPAAPQTPPPTPAPTPSRQAHTTRPAPTHEHQHQHEHAEPARAWAAEGDQPYSATLYNPFGNGTDEHAAAAPKAVDGRASTAWTTADHPGGLGKPGVGLVLEAGGFQSYSAIGIQTATPGFRVEIYSTDASDPPAGGPSAAGWRREAVKAGVKKQQRIAMKGATDQPTYLLVWITTLPAGKSRAGLSEITLLP